MKKLIQMGLGLLLWVCSQPLWAAIPTTLHFATEATFPPFEQMDAAGNVIGFEIDMTNALCKQMQVKCTYSNQPWVSLIPSLKLGKFDALISALSITEDRKKQIDFTQPYFYATAHFVAPMGSHLDTSPQGLVGKTIGVQIGTTSERYLQDIYGKKIQLKTYPNQQDALLDLMAGRVDAVLGETPVTLYWLHQQQMQNKFTLIGKPITDVTYFGSGYGIAVRKGNQELLDAFNKALVAIKADGSYQKIVDTYFPRQ